MYTLRVSLSTRSFSELMLLKPRELTAQVFDVCRATWMPGESDAGRRAPTVLPTSMPSTIATVSALSCQLASAGACATKELTDSVVGCC
mgnify:CR=1 FL=1